MRRAPSIRTVSFSQFDIEAIRQMCAWLRKERRLLIKGLFCACAVDPRSVRHCISADGHEPNLPMPISFFSISRGRLFSVSAAFVQNRKCDLRAAASYLHLKWIARRQWTASRSGEFCLHPQPGWSVVVNKSALQNPFWITASNCGVECATRFCACFCDSPCKRTVSALGFRFATRNPIVQGRTR
jgi:hypothetical protein